MKVWETINYAIFFLVALGWLYYVWTNQKSWLLRLAVTVMSVILAALSLALIGLMVRL